MSSTGDVAKVAADGDVYDVVIVGAGAGGVATAVTLAELNPSLRVVALEARRRVGGRACTVTLCGEPIDVGASWIHQWSPQNPMQSIVARLGLALVPPRRGAWQVFDGVSGADVTNANNSVVRSVVTACLDAVSRAPASCATDAAAETAYADVRRAFIDDGAVPGWTAGALPGELATPDARRRLLDFSLNRCEQYEGAGFHEMSLKYWDAGGELPGGDVVVKGGYGALLQALAASAKLDVRLQTAVERIERVAGSGLFTVTTVPTDDAGAHPTPHKVVCRRVVVAVPLGVLKAGCIDFGPALPAPKLRAISNLGCALMNKVVLVFRSRFWSAGVKVVGVAAELRRDFPWFLDLKLAMGVASRPMLMCFVTTGHAATVERLSDAETLDRCLAALAKCFVPAQSAAGRNPAPSKPVPRSGATGGGSPASGPTDTGACGGQASAAAGTPGTAGAGAGAGGAGAGAGGAGAGSGGAGEGHSPAQARVDRSTDPLEPFSMCEDRAAAARIDTHGLPALSAYLITRWKADRYARGTWTYFATGSAPADYADVAAPVDGRLFFAGEHTFMAAQGTVHGAYLSGVAAAHDVVDSAARDR